MATLFFDRFTLKQIRLPLPVKESVNEMKLWIIAVSIAVTSIGCASIKYEKTLADGTHVKASAHSLFSNSALRNMAVDYSTKTTTNGFKVTGSTTEPNPESITATGTALGEMIGKAAQAAATK